jgi:hypothetical protein
MIDFEINRRIALKLWPEKTLRFNGPDVMSDRKIVDYRKPHIMERLMYELKVFAACIEKGNVAISCPTKVYRAETLSKAVALCYIGEVNEIQTGN